MFEVQIDRNTLIVTPLINLSSVLLEWHGGETKKFLDHLLDPKVENVVVDLHQSDDFGSDFLVILIKLWKGVRQRHGRMAICNLSAKGKEILRLCELDSLWILSGSLPEAKKRVLE